MPDFERHFDSLSVHLARHFRRKRRGRGVRVGYWLGYRRGKTIARLQVVVIAAGVAVVIAAIRLIGEGL